jgi:hypothetical protein
LEDEFDNQLSKLKGYLIEDGKRVIQNIAGPEDLPKDRESSQHEMDQAIRVISEVLNSRIGVAVR